MPSNTCQAASPPDATTVETAGGNGWRPPHAIRRGTRALARWSDFLVCVVVALSISLAACRSSAENEARKERIRRAVLGGGPEKVVTGTVHGDGAGGTRATFLIALSGVLSKTCTPPPVGCHWHRSVREVFQLPLTVRSSVGATVISGSINGIWEARTGWLSWTEVSRTKRVDDAALLTGDRLWSFSEGDKLSVFGLVEDRDGVSGIYGEMQLIVGDPDIFVHGI